ncbi:MAG: F0F1 ATP synthase subunit epsilon [Burkholderiales bacterium]|nr:F0F1 ATP synthase subunit epsilon [Burkholderiales bacterium]
MTTAPPPGLHFVLTSLGSVLVDALGVQSLRAEDPSGSFGILPGHADFLTVLTVGVLSWREADGRWRHCALRRGVLTLRGGRELSVATREAVPGAEIAELVPEVLARLTRRQKTEDDARRESRQLEVRALRELVRPLRPGSLHPPALP